MSIFFPAWKSKNKEKAIKGFISFCRQYGPGSPYDEAFYQAQLNIVSQAATLADIRIVAISKITGRDSLLWSANNDKDESVRDAANARLASLPVPLSGKKTKSALGGNNNSRPAKKSKFGQHDLKIIDSALTYLMNVGQSTNNMNTVRQCTEVIRKLQHDLELTGGDMDLIRACLIRYESDIPDLIAVNPQYRARSAELLEDRDYITQKLLPRF